MVQVLRNNQTPSFKKAFFEGLSEQIPDVLETYMNRKKEEAERARQDQHLEEENQALESQGINVRGVRNPKLREAILDRKVEEDKRSSVKVNDQETYDVIKKYYGQEAAEIYTHLTEGGKTKFSETLIVTGKLER